MEKSTVRCDVLVIGGATAGCFAAITAKERGLDVLVLDKAGAGKAGASIMASGFWAVFNEDWGMDYDATLRWINANSSYLNNRNWTEAFLQDSWGTYLDLKRFGVRFPIAEEDMSGFFRQSIIGDDDAGHHDDDPHTHYGTIPLSHRTVTPALRRYAQSIGVRFLDRTMVTDLLVHCGVCRGAAGFDPRYVTQLLQNYMMPYYILHIKEGGRLRATLELISFLRSHLIPKMRAEDAHMLRLVHETENMALNAEMMLRAALYRTESRGWHFREDFPRENDAEWLAWGRMHCGERGEMVMDKVPVPDAWRPKGAPDYRERWLAWEKWDEPAEKEGV